MPNDGARMWENEYPQFGAGRFGGINNGSIGDGDGAVGGYPTYRWAARYDSLLNDNGNGEIIMSKKNNELGQHIGYRYDVNLLADPKKITPFLRKYLDIMGWNDLNWLEDIHMGYEEGQAAVFDRNINAWVTVPKNMKLPKEQQERDMIARELLVKFQMSRKHPLVDLKKTYSKC